MSFLEQHELRSLYPDKKKEIIPPAIPDTVKDLPITRVACAAVKYTVKSTGQEIVFPGVRHYSPDMFCHIAAYVAAGLMPTLDSPDLEEHQGFLDAYGRYLSRAQAWVAAERSNQILPNRTGPAGILFSEDLY